jgi:chemotaxis protein CheD
MLNSEAGLPEVTLSPGEYFLACNETVIHTLLGSCVGISFWCERLGIGALCHAMLPKRPTEHPAPLDSAHGYRYVDFCIRDLGRQFDALGANRGEVEVKLFGGADMFRASGPDARQTIGTLNCDMALEVLQDEGFRVIASNLRQTSGVKIRFNTRSGDVMLLRLD